MTRIGGIGPTGPVAPVQRRADRPGDAAFERALEALLPETKGPEAKGVRFSKHAEARIESRTAEVGPEEIERLSAGMDALAARGARKGLVLTEHSAWVVGVDKRTVITVLSRAEARETVFTDIDGAYVAT